MNINAVIDIGQLFGNELALFLPENRFQESTKVSTFRNLVINNHLDGIIDLINFETDKAHFHDYLYISFEERNDEIFNFLLQNGIDINTENEKGETILYLFSKTASLIKIKRLLAYGALIDLTETFYHPVIATLIDKKVNEKVFYYYLSQRINLNVVDKNNETILMKLIKKKQTNLIYYFCTKYLKMYGKQKFREFLCIKNQSYQTSLDIAATVDEFDIIKYLIVKGSIYTKIIETKNGYHKIINLSKQPQSTRWIAIINCNMDFNMFTKKIMITTCPEWCKGTNLLTFRKLYNLPYPKTTIVKWANYCCQNHISHDQDSINHFCRKEIIEISTKKIQQIFQKRKKRTKKMGAILKIQKNYRRHFYKRFLQEDCSICGIILNNSNCYKLPCGHILHAFCINRWRRESNSCPYCRKIIANYSIHL